MNSEKLYQMGWQPQTTLADGIRSTYEWFLGNLQEDLYVTNNKSTAAANN
jgi:dTDP-D-glucose 4,6-dehydratase